MPKISQKIYKVFLRLILYKLVYTVWQMGAEIFPFTTNTVSAPRLGKVGAKNVLVPLLNIQSRRGGLLHGEKKKGSVVEPC